MRRMSMRIATALLAFLFLLSLAACSSGTQDNAGSGDTVPLSAGESPGKESPGKESPGKGELDGSGGHQKKAETVVSDEEKAQEALTWLQEYMEEYVPQAAMAVAYLGYREADDTTPLTEWLWNQVPGLMETMPFIRTIPPENILGSGYGDLYCIVPRDDRTTLSVNHVTWKSTGNGVWPESDNVLYREEYARPVLVYVGYEQFFDEPDIEIIAGDGGGAGGLVTWYPVWNAMDGGYMMIPFGEGDLPLVLDFTYFDDAASLNIWGDSDSSDPSGDGWWLPPTEEGLEDSCWVCDGWSVNLLGGGGEPGYAGIAELYYQFEDGQEYQLVYSGFWRMVDDCLQLNVSTGVGNSPSDASGIFPVLLDPSGDYLLIWQDRDNGMCPPFFEDGMSSAELIRSYG